MTGASRDGRENTDVSVTPNLGNSLHYVQAIIGGTVAKVCNIDSPWRPPLKFKGIKAIYESEDDSCIYSSSSIHQQASTDNGSLSGNQVKMEMPSPKQCYSSRGSIEDSVTDDGENKYANSCCDKEICNECSDITLKELLTKCKAKKRKVLKFTDTTETDDRSHQSKTQENNHVQQNELESDLQEPLIILKQKLSKNSIPEKKRRKCALSSPAKSVFQVKELNEQEVLFSSSETTQYSKYLETHSMPVVRGLSNDNGHPVQFKDIIGEVSVAESYHCPIAIDAADCPNSHLSLKTDFSWESSSEVSQRVEENELATGQVSSLAKNSPKCQVKELPTFLSESAEQNFGVTARKDSTEIAAHLSSPSSVSDPKDFSHAKSLEPVYSVKNEIVEADSWDHQNAVHFTDWSSSGFDDKFYHSGESSSNVLENSDCTCSCAQEVSTKSQELNRDENFIVEGMESSEMTSHIYSLSSAWESIINSLFTGNLISDSAAVKLGNETHNGSKSCKILQEEIACQTVSQNDYSSVDDNGKTINIHSGTDLCAVNMADEYIDDSVALKLGNETHDYNKSCKIPGKEIACQTVSQNDYSSVDDSGKTINLHSGTDFCAVNMEDEYIDDSAALKLGNETHDDIKSCKSPQGEIAYQTVHQNDYSSVDDHGMTITIHSGTDFCAVNVADEYIDVSTDEVPSEKEVTDYSDVCISIREGEAPGDYSGALAGEMQLNCHKKDTPLYLDSFSKSFTNTLCAQSSCQQSTCLDYQPPIDDYLPKTGKYFPSPAGEEASYAGVDKGVNCSSKISHSTDVEGITVTEAPESSSQNIQPLLSSDGLLSIGGASCEIEEKLSSPMVEEISDNCADKTRDHSTVAFHSIDGEGLTASEALKCYEGTELEHQPIKLLSNRKSLSPTSQEKLIHATDAKEQFGSHGEAEVMLSPENMRKHPKKARSGFVPRTTKGILKSPLSSCSNSCSCIEGSLVHMHAQRAIRFSRLQMHDIESIAMKLLKGLQSMRGIAEETLCSEACLSAHSESAADEIRIAVKNASELEETTKKWLSMMARDCSRFCKIMHRSTDVRKRRKKIIFADEAGGMLCHVKVFHPASVADSESEKADQQTASMVDSQSGNANQ